MKLIKAVIKPHKVDPVREALAGLGVSAMTATEIKAFDKQMGHAEIHRGKEYAIAFMPMVHVEAVVADGMVDEAVDAIRRTAGTDNPGDGKIFVCEALSALRIHTGETGEAAL